MAPRHGKKKVYESSRYVKDIKSADVWSVFKIIADFVQGFDELGELGPSVTIFGSARLDEKHPYYQQAMKLSAMLAERGYNIITGGGPGIMEAANRGAYDYENVESIGLNIELAAEHQPNPSQQPELRRASGVGPRWNHHGFRHHQHHLSPSSYSEDGYPAYREFSEADPRFCGS